eukprot:6202199-Pleurochrysis_carterae.AAC.3
MPQTIEVEAARSVIDSGSATSDRSGRWSGLATKQREAAVCDSPSTFRALVAATERRRRRRQRLWPSFLSRPAPRRAAPPPGCATYIELRALAGYV